MDHQLESERKKSYIGHAVSGAFDLVAGDLQANQQNDKLKSEVSYYGGGFLKTASLFLRGRYALPAAMAVYALDEMKPGDAVGTQMLDGTLGAGKGAGMRAAFSLTGGIRDHAAKGLVLGMASRTTEIGLTRSNYLNSDGSFSLKTGMGNLQKGVLSKEALAFDVIAFGASGSLIGSLDRASGGAVRRSPFLSTVLTGTTFGVTTGGLEELQKQGRAGTFDFGEVAKRAMLKGAIDSVAAIPGGLQARSHFRTQMENGNRQEVRPTLSEPIDLRSIAVNPEMATGAQLTSLSQRLSKPRSTSMFIEVANPERPAEFTSEQHFLRTGLKNEEVQGRVYELGEVQIAVPEAYAGKLDLVRQYRTEIAGKPAGQHQSIAKRILGEDSHLATRALPEDFVNAIEALPDSRLLRRLNLLDINNPQDVWNRQQMNDPSFTSVAVKGPEGEVTFFRKLHDRYLQSDVSHEWAHALRDRRPNDGQLFDVAAEIEAGGYMQRPYAGKKPSENWAVHLGEDFLNRDADVFINLTRQAPVRSVVLARALQESVANSTSPHAEIYRGRLNHVEQNVWPQVRQQLRDAVAQGTANSANSARLLVNLATPAELAAIPELSKVDLSHTVTSDATLARMSNMRQVVELDLTGTHISPEGPKHIRDIASISKLTLRDTASDNSTLRHVSNLKNVTELDLANTAVDNVGLVHLVEMPNLRVLDLSGTGVTRQAIARFRSEHPKGSTMEIITD